MARGPFGAGGDRTQHFLLQGRGLDTAHAVRLVAQHADAAEQQRASDGESKHLRAAELAAVAERLFDKLPA
jgi:hypothetical protein